MEHYPVRMNLHTSRTTLIEFAGQPPFVGAVYPLDVENEFVEFQRIVVDLPELHLPRPDIRCVIEHVLQFIEIDESAFDFVEIHLLNLRAARNVTEQPWQ